MFTPSDLCIRRLREEDHQQVLNMINYIQKEEESAELKRQVKAMFLHPAMWIISGVLICVIGISLDLPPVPTSIVVLILTWLYSRRHFQTYWNKVKAIFNRSAQDLADLKSFYVDTGEKRCFFVALHRNRVVGTAAIREAPDVPPSARTCKLWRVFVHPATRRMGIATKLIEECVQVAKRMSYSRLVVRTHATNVGGVKLYDACSFQRLPETILADAYPLKYRVINFYKSLLSQDEELSDEQENEDASSSRCSSSNNSNNNQE